MLHTWIATALDEFHRVTEIYVGLPPRCLRTHFFSAHRERLGNLRDDLFADDLDGTQDVFLGGHDEAQQQMRRP
jgi:hypothetical protein